MALQAIISRGAVRKIVLQERPEGVYIFLFATAEARTSYRDELQDSIQIAKRVCLEDYGITDAIWREIPDTGLMAR